MRRPREQEMAAADVYFFRSDFFGAVVYYYLERLEGGVWMTRELLKQMVEQYGNRIYRLALRYTGDSYLAEDITQETFLRAYNRIHSYDRNRPAGPWLFRIAVNLCRNRRRDSREIAMEIKGESPVPGPEQHYLERESERELMDALHSLPEMYREVLILKHVSELSYSEICAVLGLELSLVKNRLYRGRIMLREALRKGESIR